VGRMPGKPTPAAMSSPARRLRRPRAARPTSLRRVGDFCRSCDRVLRCPHIEVTDSYPDGKIAVAVYDTFDPATGASPQCRKPLGRGGTRFAIKFATKPTQSFPNSGQTLSNTCNPPTQKPRSKRVCP